MKGAVRAPFTFRGLRSWIRGAHVIPGNIGAVSQDNQKSPRVALGLSDVSCEGNHLYPQHQAIVSRARYVGCESLSPLPTVTRVKVLSVKPDLISVPGLDRSVVGYTITLRTTFQDMRFGKYDVPRLVSARTVACVSPGTPGRARYARAFA